MSQCWTITTDHIYGPAMGQERVGLQAPGTKNDNLIWKDETFLDGFIALFSVLFLAIIGWVCNCFQGKFGSPVILFEYRVVHLGRNYRIQMRPVGTKRWGYLLQTIGQTEVPVQFTDYVQAKLTIDNQIWDQDYRFSRSSFATG
jgi:hypothetical protein